MNVGGGKQESRAGTLHRGGGIQGQAGFGGGAEGRLVRGMIDINVGK